MLRYVYIVYLVYNYPHVLKLEEPLTLMQLDDNLTVPWTLWFKPRLLYMRCIVDEVPLEQAS